MTSISDTARQTTSRVEASRRTAGGRASPLLCALGSHRIDPIAMWNDGYYFSRCRRCGRDLVRTAFDGWHEPRGFRVVWRAQAPTRARQAERVANAELIPDSAEALAGDAITFIDHAYGAPVDADARDAGMTDGLFEFPVQDRERATAPAETEALVGTDAPFAPGSSLAIEAEANLATVPRLATGPSEPATHASPPVWLQVSDVPPPQAPMRAVLAPIAAMPPVEAKVAGAVVGTSSLDEAMDKGDGRRRYPVIPDFMDEEADIAWDGILAQPKPIAPAQFMLRSRSGGGHTSAADKPPQPDRQTSPPRRESMLQPARDDDERGAIPFARLTEPRRKGGPAAMSSRLARRAAVTAALVGGLLIVAALVDGGNGSPASVLRPRPAPQPAAVPAADPQPAATRRAESSPSVAAPALVEPSIDAGTSAGEGITGDPAPQAAATPAPD